SLGYSGVAAAGSARAQGSGEAKHGVEGRRRMVRPCPLAALGFPRAGRALFFLQSTRALTDTPVMGPRRNDTFRKYLRVFSQVKCNRGGAVVASPNGIPADHAERAASPVSIDSGHRAKRGYPFLTY